MTHVEAVRIEHFPALVRFFEACASSCFCRYWHFTGTKNDWLERSAFRPDENAAELEGAIRDKRPDGRGLVALDDSGEVLGWLKLTPRAAVPKLRALPVYRNLALGDEETTYSIGCVLVRPDARGRGVLRALVDAAPRTAKEWGARAVEAYPRRSSEPLYAEEVWQGPERVFVEAGFDVVAGDPPYPVYRRDV